MDIQISVRVWKYTHSLVMWASLLILGVTNNQTTLHLIAGGVFLISCVVNLSEWFWIKREMVLSSEGLRVGKRFFPMDTIRRITIRRNNTGFQIVFKNKWQDAPVIILDKRDPVHIQQIKQWAWKNGTEVRHPFTRNRQ